MLHRPNVQSARQNTFERNLLFIIKVFQHSASNELIVVALGEFWGAAHLLSGWLSHKSMEVGQQWGPSAEERATSQHELGLELPAWLKTKTWGLGGVGEKVERKIS